MRHDQHLAMNPSAFLRISLNTSMSSLALGHQWQAQRRGTGTCQVDGSMVDFS